jgi:hypothetical protein
MAAQQLTSADLQHHLFTLTFRGKHFHAPIDETKLQRILDAGTGTGVWAMDIGVLQPMSANWRIVLTSTGDKFPHAEVRPCALLSKRYRALTDIGIWRRPQPYSTNIVSTRNEVAILLSEHEY